MDEETIDLSKMKWTIIDLDVEDDKQNVEEAVDSSYNSFSYKSVVSSSSRRKIMQHGVLLKRLLKAEYYSKLLAFDRCNTEFAYISPYPFAARFDEHIFVNMADKTMWMMVEEPMVLDKFYEMIMSSELENKWPGCTIDQNPTYGFVPLIELKMHLADWWCK